MYRRWKTSRSRNPIVNGCDNTSDKITPNPSTVAHGKKITFTATITDTSVGPTSPTGKISWKASVSGGIFSSLTCNLAPVNSSQSQCHVVYTAPSTTGLDTITGTYSGDNTHDKSSNVSELTIT